MNIYKKIPRIIAVLFLFLVACNGQVNMSGEININISESNSPGVNNIVKSPRPEECWNNCVDWIPGVYLTTVYPGGQKEVTLNVVGGTIIGVFEVNNRTPQSIYVTYASVKNIAPFTGTTEYDLWVSYNDSIINELTPIFSGEKNTNFGMFTNEKQILPNQRRIFQIVISRRTPIVPPTISSWDMMFEIDSIKYRKEGETVEQPVLGLPASLGKVVSPP